MEPWLTCGKLMNLYPISHPMQLQSFPQFSPVLQDSDLFWGFLWHDSSSRASEYGTVAFRANFLPNLSSLPPLSCLPTSILASLALLPPRVTGILKKGQLIVAALFHNKKEAKLIAMKKNPHLLPFSPLPSLSVFQFRGRKAWECTYLLSPHRLPQAAGASHESLECLCRLCDPDLWSERHREYFYWFLPGFS